ncbi:MAG: glucokinase [Anaerolineaceae bacterium]
MEAFQLAGDIGGTKTTLAIVNLNQDPHIFLEKATYPSKDYASLEALVSDYLHDKPYPLTRACFDIAGPVTEGKVQATNIPWFVEETALQNMLHVPVHLLNDLTAIALAVPTLGQDDLITLQAGQPVNQGAIAVIAPGTGLGEAFLLWCGKRYQAFPSEGGHVDFAPTDDLQLKLLNYLYNHYGHVSYERISSGSGIPNLYAFLKESEIYPEPKWLAEQLARGGDPAPIISLAALEGTAEIAVAAMNLFTTILASEAGNLTLKVLATGGVYLGGGIPPRILPFLRKASFLSAFQNKGRFSEMLSRVPVHIIRNPEVALIGAARYGMEQAEL